MQKNKIDIIVPFYNPADNWEEVCTKRWEELETALKDKCSFKLILVNDGSSKDVRDDIEKLKSRIPTLEYYTYKNNKGKGGAIKYGLQYAESGHYLFTDIDFPYSLNSMKDIIDYYQNGNADIVAGKRSSDYYKQIPIKRRIISRALRFGNRVFLRLPFSDTQCGLKIFNEKGRNIFLSTITNRFLIDIEFLKLASKAKLKLDNQIVYIRDGIELSEVKTGKLFKELYHYIRLILK